MVFTNAADGGFFGQRRDASNTEAAMVIVKCKNYSKDIANEELDQLLGRFDKNRGRFGIVTCRSVDNRPRLAQRLLDMSSRAQAFIIVLTDEDIVAMLKAKTELREHKIEEMLHAKFRGSLA